MEKLYTGKGVINAGLVFTAVIAGLVFTAVIMTTSYGAAVFSAIIPKMTWGWADIDKTGKFPFHAYLLSALLAVLLGLVAMISIRYTQNAIVGLDNSANITKVWGDIKWSYPYLAQSAFIGFFAAYAMDLFRIQTGPAPKYVRAVDVLILGGGMVVASVIAHRWMEGLPPFEGTREIAYRGQLNIEFFLESDSKLYV